MEENLHDEIREIKKSLRLSMNGVVSTLQRRQGLDYKINFGVELPRLKGIANAHAKNRELATALWQENIRECKILAILLMPEEGYADVAEKWISETKFTEIADILAMNLLSRLPDAIDRSLQWTGRSDGLYRYCGFITISHSLRRGVTISDRQEAALLGNIITMPFGDSVTRKCADNAILYYIDRTQGAAERLKDALKTKPGDINGIGLLIDNIE